MKKLLYLIILVLLVVIILQSGMVDTTQLTEWGSQAIDWTLDRSAEFIEQLRAARRGQKSGGSEQSNTGILLVNESHPLPENYEVQDLINLYEQPRSFSLSRSDLYLTREAFEAAQNMFAAAAQEGQTGFILTSAYRTRDAQREMYATSAAGTAQKPGCSEHETGLAFDVTVQRPDGQPFEDTTQGQWLMAHCAEYGYIQRYPAGKESITGISYEPWHYRYVGITAAQEITQRGLTLEEYVQNQ